MLGEIDMIENQGVKIVVAIICLIFGVLGVYGIYSGLYKRANATDYAYVGKYALYVDQEGNVEDVSKQNDLLLIRNDGSYTKGDTILFTYHGMGKLAKITKSSGGKYYLTDSYNSFDSEYQIESYMIAGRVIQRYRGLGWLYNIICTPYASIIILILLFFFGMTTLRRNE
jgi:hypothetical protein